MTQSLTADAKITRMAVKFEFADTRFIDAKYLSKRSSRQFVIRINGSTLYRLCPLCMYVCITTVDTYLKNLIIMSKTYDISKGSYSTNSKLHERTRNALTLQERDLVIIWVQISLLFFSCLRTGAYLLWVIT